MTVISIQQVSLRFGGLPLLDQATLHLEPGERVALVGRNGEGKSSLLRLLAGDLAPDSGTIARAASTRIALLPQMWDTPEHGTVFELVHAGVPEGPNAARRAAQAEKAISQVGLLKRYSDEPTPSN